MCTRQHIDASLKNMQHIMDRSEKKSDTSRLSLNVSIGGLVVGLIGIAISILLSQCSYDYFHKGSKAELSLCIGADYKEGTTAYVSVPEWVDTVKLLSCIQSFNNLEEKPEIINVIDFPFCISIDSGKPPTSVDYSVFASNSTVDSYNGMFVKDLKKLINLFKEKPFKVPSQYTKVREKENVTVTEFKSALLDEQYVVYQDISISQDTICEILYDITIHQKSYPSRKCVVKNTVITIGGDYEYYDNNYFGFILDSFVKKSKNLDDDLVCVRYKNNQLDTETLSIVSQNLDVALQPFNSKPYSHFYYNSKYFILILEFLLLIFSVYLLYRLMHRTSRLLHTNKLEKLSHQNRIIKSVGIRFVFVLIIIFVLYYLMRVHIDSFPQTSIF